MSVNQLTWKWPGTLGRPGYHWRWRTRKECWHYLWRNQTELDLALKVGLSNPVCHLLGTPPTPCTGRSDDCLQDLMGNRLDVSSSLSSPQSTHPHHKQPLQWYNKKEKRKITYINSVVFVSVYTSIPSTFSVITDNKIIEFYKNAVR